MTRTVITLLFGGMLSSCSIITDLVQQNSPIIESFTVDPGEGSAPLDVLFEWQVSDPDGDAFTCTLDYGDGATTRVEACNDTSVAFHSYEKSGNYIAKLTADDGGTPISNSVPLVVGQANSPGAADLAITSFSAEPNQGAAPLLTALSWTLQAAGSATCTLSFGDGSDDEIVENCQDITDTFHTFRKAGGYRVILEARSGDTTLRRSLAVVVDSDAG